VQSRPAQNLYDASTVLLVEASVARCVRRVIGSTRIEIFDSARIAAELGLGFSCPSGLHFFMPTGSRGEPVKDYCSLTSCREESILCRAKSGDRLEIETIAESWAVSGEDDSNKSHVGLSDGLTSRILTPATDEGVRMKTLFDTRSHYPEANGQAALALMICFLDVLSRKTDLLRQGETSLIVEEAIRILPSSPHPMDEAARELVEALRGRFKKAPK
jgi:hypothetical protein